MSIYNLLNKTYEHKTENVKLYLIKEDNFTLLFVRKWVSEFDISPHNLRPVYVNKIVKCFDNLKQTDTGTRIITSSNFRLEFQSWCNSIRISVAQVIS